jgi:aerobic carbon-monoxide dehydrogenase small subunit
MEKHPLELTINGKKHRIDVEHRKTLADAIRDDCGLTGTHVGCEHGVCGACTVIADGKPVRSCLIFAHQAEGAEIRTVESLADGDRLHPLQQAFIDNHAIQCGFCTPGFLMLVIGALESDPDMVEDELIELLSSNLCRCTGYQNIIKAVRAFAEHVRTERAEASPRRGGSNNATF